MSSQQKEIEKKIVLLKKVQRTKTIKAQEKLQQLVVSNWKATGFLGATRTERIHRKKCSETEILQWNEFWNTYECTVHRINKLSW